MDIDNNSHGITLTLYTKLVFYNIVIRRIERFPSTGITYNTANFQAAKKNHVSEIIRKNVNQTKEINVGYERFETEPKKKGNMLDE